MDIKDTLRNVTHYVNVNAFLSDLENRQPFPKCSSDSDSSFRPHQAVTKVYDLDVAEMPESLQTQHRKTVKYFKRDGAYHITDIPLEFHFVMKNINNF